MVAVESEKAKERMVGESGQNAMALVAPRWHQKQEPADFSHSGRDSGIQGLAVTSDHAL